MYYLLKSSPLVFQMQLCSQLEQLEKDNQILREGKTTVAGEGSFPASSMDGELLRLQAENSALQKNMAGSILTGIQLWGLKLKFGKIQGIGQREDWQGGALYSNLPQIWPLLRLLGLDDHTARWGRLPARLQYCRRKSYLPSRFV